MMSYNVAADVKEKELPDVAARPQSTGTLIASSVMGLTNTAGGGSANTRPDALHDWEGNSSGSNDGFCGRNSPTATTDGRALGSPMGGCDTRVSECDRDSNPRRESRTSDESRHRPETTPGSRVDRERTALNHRRSVRRRPNPHQGSPERAPGGRAAVDDKEERPHVVVVWRG
jgi:hypothetical protein